MKQKVKWQREAKVEECVEQYLINKGYIIVPKERRKNKTRGPGIDIQAYKQTKTKNFSSAYYIECKGKTKNTYVTSNEVFGQIFKRIGNKMNLSQNYIIALPDIKEFRHELNKISKFTFKTLSKRLNLRVWFVDKKGKVSTRKC